MRSLEDVVEGAFEVLQQKVQVEDLVEILSVDEAKAKEIHEAVHQETPAAQQRRFGGEPAMADILKFSNGNENDDQDHSSAQDRDRSQTGQGRRFTQHSSR